MQVTQRDNAPGVPGAFLYRYLDIDTGTFRSHFNREPFLFRHQLSDHPLFGLSRLVKLARALRSDLVEYNAGDIPINLPDWENTPYTGLSAEDTIRKIEEHRSWMVLKRAEADSDYRGLLDRCLDQIQPLSEPIEPGMCEREAAVFVSSPSSITPYHMDHEINFLLQIAGRKTVSVFGAADREVLSDRELEDYFSGPAIHRNLKFEERYQARAKVFELTAGYGLHIPSTAPHWVKNGDAVSMSLSVSFKTIASLRRGAIYRANARLRKIGLTPSPYGGSALRDTTKYHLFRALGQGQKLLGARPSAM